MKFTDYLKKAFGIDTETEVDENGNPTSTSGTEETQKTDETVVDKGNGVGDDVASGTDKGAKPAGTETTPKETTPATEETPTEPTTEFETGWFNKETGTIDASKIHNADVLDAINMLQEQASMSNLNSQVDTEIDGFMKANNVTITKESLKKLVDLSGAKLDEDGKVTGVKEALDNFKTSEPGLFNTTIEAEKTPLEEGLSPTDPVGTEQPSWDAAFDSAIGNI